jgi:hypothetical protein
MTHTILTRCGEIVRTADPVAEIAGGQWGDVLGVAHNGTDVTHETFRAVAGVLREQGYTREELPEYLVDSLRIW